MHSIESS